MNNHASKNGSKTLEGLECLEGLLNWNKID